jgi:hypothetical protein
MAYYELGRWLLAQLQLLLISETNLQYCTDRTSHIQPWNLGNDNINHQVCRLHAIEPIFGFGIGREKLRFGILMG